MNQWTFPLPEMVIAFTGTLFWMFLTIRLAPRIGLMDIPSGRKNHPNSVPTVGGVAIFLGLIPAIIGLDNPVPFQNRLELSALLILSLGIWDDRIGISVRIRFSAQFVVGLIIVGAGGLTVMSLGDLVGLGEVFLGPWASFFTIICIIGVINALNMVDGVDGLAAGSALVSFMALLYLAISAQRTAEAELLLLILSALVAFFLFNARLFGCTNAKLFLGDAGSMILGLFLAWFTISLSQTMISGGEQPLDSAFPAVVALWLVAVPLIEMFSSFARRIIRGEDPSKPDLNHFHHLLLRSGLSVNQTVLISMGIGLGIILTGLSLFSMDLPEYLLFYALLAIFAFYCLFTLKFWQDR
ncbi:MAG: undecaprenyl/decaprenyl-phosphate alpha-N-acetylglucosaminyl 1-phosphate transferase [Magnetococcales bacterium]|nr:undecaprenyl/decaprenyl-phosphate alpha-N-acetylglucosaminyl 1-phosphate transferase [Magnetococcales bacterium]